MVAQVKVEHPVDEKFGGRLNSFEAQMHINALELSTILYSLRTTCSEMSGVHIRIMTDNTAAKLFFRNQGSVRSFLLLYNYKTNMVLAN